MARYCSMTITNKSIAPTEEVAAEKKGSSTLRFLRKRRAEKQASDAEQTIQLDSGFELFSINSESSEHRDEGKGCLKIRSHAESLERSVSNFNKHLLPLKKSVSFGDVAIYSHGILLGDNPSVSGGPPLTIRWAAFDKQKVSLDDYEQAKPESRPKEAMLLPRMIREEWLRNNGYARGEVRATILAVEKIKQQRYQSTRDGLWRKKVQRMVGL
ncbi:hypothetical protein MPSEU_000138700 [Mayamaea pseudoterrestris]|nr:hypothetical protein MPSEU_000138700 [Mayamaea pseudoterrestris]